AMPVILRDLPFFDHNTSVVVAGQSHRVLAWQPIVWVSVEHEALRELSPHTPRFPAVYDSGFTDTLLIHVGQLHRFAGLNPEYLPIPPEIMRPRGRRVPIHAANVWLHPNRPGSRDEFSGAAPLLLEVARGVGISDDPEGFPRLPLIGPRNFRPARLEVCID